MTIDELHRLVMDGYNAETKTLELTSSPFDSEQVKMLFKNFLEDDQLTLHESSRPRLTQQDTVEIDMAVLSHDFMALASPRVSARFYLDKDQKPQVELFISSETLNTN